MINFINSLTDKYNVLQLSHAHRINGVVDIWNNSKTVYDITKGIYTNFTDPKELESHCLQILESNPRREAYKKLKGGGISYKEFKNEIRNQKKDPEAVRAEDYHWNKDLNKTGDDHLYFLINEGKVKIGRSASPKKRLDALATAIPERCIMFVFKGKGFMEGTLHDCFDDVHITREWFRHELRIQNFLKKYHNSTTGYKLATRTKKQQEQSGWKL